MTESLSEYFERTTGEKSTRAIALKAGLDPSTLGRQLDGRSRLVIETVVAVCRAYGLLIPEALAAAGFITETEAHTFGIRPALAEIPEEELTAEMLRRIKRGQAGPIVTEPAPEEFVDRALRDE